MPRSSAPAHHSRSGFDWLKRINYECCGCFHHRVPMRNRTEWHCVTCMKKLCFVCIFEHTKKYHIIREVANNLL